MPNTRKRNVNLDLIRTVAVFSVLSVHFFLNNGFYSQKMVGVPLLAATIVRTLFMVCVPLFMILTGYLMCYKKLSREYYFGITKTLFVYFFGTVCILLFRVYYRKEELTLFGAITNITSFQHYSWYVGMYLGLFLLIPFLNLIYNNLDGSGPRKRQKIVLIITLLVLSALPSLINFKFPLLPSWWIRIYPLTYYFIGAYIREFKDEMKLSLFSNFVLFTFTVALSGGYCFYRSYGEKFVWGAWNDWGGFTNVINATLLFLFLVRLKLDNLPSFIKTILRSISQVSLGIYIVSWIFDKYAYPKLNAAVPNMIDRLPYYFLVVPVNFLCAFILAYLIHLVYLGLTSLVKLTCQAKQ